MRRSINALAVAALGLLISRSAAAHLLGADDGMLAGFAHPLLGVDHVLAMVAVGLWAAQTGGRAIWAVPLTFMATLAAGAWLGVGGFALPGVEAGVAASVLALGLLVALAVRLPVAAGMALTAAFALFHGHSHGTELPAMVSPLGYAAGFLVATGLLHCSGLAASCVFSVRQLRLAGFCVAVAGAALLAAI